ncbi:hypothetical protein HK104_002453 [Borealophlyctis nickersoniae]|nr:hypothetical protein HK104_002453 [Borealophlyctis nickersoniae]
MEQRFITFASHLLRMGADMARDDDTGWDVLAYTAYLNKADTVRFLLDAGASTQTDVSWALDLAAPEGHERVVRLLLAWTGSCCAHALRAATSKGHVGVVRAILEAGRGGVDSLTLRRDLAAAARVGDEGMVNVFLEFGASVRGAQPSLLADAVAGGKSRMVKRFSELGAVRRKVDLVKTLKDLDDGRTVEWRGRKAVWREEYNKISEMLRERGIEAPPKPEPYSINLSRTICAEKALGSVIPPSVGKGRGTGSARKGPE